MQRQTLPAPVPVTTSLSSIMDNATPVSQERYSKGLNHHECITVRFLLIMPDRAIALRDRNEFLPSFRLSAPC